jgi:hypothetical protein
MNHPHFFTPAVASFDAFAAPKRGRPVADAIDRMRAKAWYHFLAHKLGDLSPNRLGELFEVEDTNLFRKYKLGRSVPEKYVKKAERLVPGSLAMLQDGPRGLFVAMQGDVEACWRFASVFEGDGSQCVGRDLPLELSVSRMSALVAAEMESGYEHEFVQFVQLLALWRIQNEAAKVMGVVQEGLYELLLAMVERSNAIATVLRSLDIGEDLFVWLADKQARRLRLDPTWQMAFELWRERHGHDPWEAYVVNPLAVAAELPLMHARHPYLDAMPNVLSSLATKSSARRCV